MELDGLPSTVMPPSAVTLTFDLLLCQYVSGLGTYTWPNFGKISLNIYEDIVFIPYIMVIACCHPNWPLAPKANQHICESDYICDQKWVWVSSLHWFVRYGVRRGCGSLPTVTLTFDLLTKSVCAIQAQVHAWPNFGEIRSHMYKDSSGKVGTLWPLLAVTLPLAFWPQNLISTSTNLNTSVTKIRWNYLRWFLRFGVHKVFGL